MQQQLALHSLRSCRRALAPLAVLARAPHTRSARDPADAGPGYPPLPPNADGRSCGEHKDYGNLTFLHTDSTPDALQVLSRSGEWINANPIPGCVVVNIGAMWDKWTGGMYPATLHRVIHKNPTYRVSLPFFFEPNFDSVITLLDAAKRTAAAEGIVLAPEEDVVYGDYLVGKVSGNFKY